MAKLKFNFILAMYRRNNLGRPCVWYAEPYNESEYIVHYGIVGKKITTTYHIAVRDVNAEIASLKNKKAKEGYKYLNEIRDDDSIPLEPNLYDWLNKYLPINRTNAAGNLLPMLAKTFNNTNNKVFKACPLYYGQWKINGLRCFITAHKDERRLFNPYYFKFQSREGTIWNSLVDLNDYLVSNIPLNFIEKMIENDWALDGELYLPGFSVNQIDHFVKDPKSKENKLIQFWCYDLAGDEIAQNNRLQIISELDKTIAIRDKNEHLNITSRFNVLPSVLVYDESEAIIGRDKSIELGFEGLILRKPNALYQYGKRNSSMFKFKRATDGKFKIIDIYPEGKKRNNIPLFLLKNDINDAEFEVHINGSFDYQAQFLTNKKLYIGKYMYLTFGERSGVNAVPFHVKEVKIII